MKARFEIEMATKSPDGMDQLQELVDYIKSGKFQIDMRSGGKRGYREMRVKATVDVIYD